MLSRTELMVLHYILALIQYIIYSCLTTVYIRETHQAHKQLFYSALDENNHNVAFHVLFKVSLWTSLYNMRLGQLVNYIL